MISAFFPDLVEADKERMLDRLLSTRKSRVVRPRALRDVLVAMDDHESRDFKDLKDFVEDQEREELVRSRFSAPRAKAEAKTPSVIKELRPKVVGSVLIYQVSTCTFQGYYPKGLGPGVSKKPKAGSSFSTGRTVGDKWTGLQALSQVVNFLWNHHKKAGHASWRVWKTFMFFNFGLVGRTSQDFSLMFFVRSQLKIKPCHRHQLTWQNRPWLEPF